MMEEKTMLLKVELMKEKKLREEAEDRMARETQEDAIVKRMHDELAKVQQAMSIESTTRVESEHALIQVLDDMCNKMQGEVQSERCDREGTEEVFLKVLEETCDRVQVGLHQP